MKCRIAVMYAMPLYCTTSTLYTFSYTVSRPNTQEPIAQPSLPLDEASHCFRPNRLGAGAGAGPVSPDILGVMLQAQKIRFQVESTVILFTIKL